MLRQSLHDGVTFVGECFNRLFTPRELRCHNCQGVLREEITTAGNANLVCSTKGKGCPSPVKSFETSHAMYQWRDTTWEVIARVCREHS